MTPADGYGPVLTGVAFTAGLGLVAWALGRFVLEKVEERDKAKREEKRDERNARPTEIRAASADLRAALAEFEIRLRNNLIDPMRAEISELHGCVDGAREDMADLRRDVREDIAAIIKPIVDLVANINERLHHVESLERKR